MARRRTLHPEERELWHAVARTARPMHNSAEIPKPPVSADPVSPPLTPPPKPRPIAPLFRLGEKARSQTTAAQPTTSLQMDAKAYGKMTRGKLSPEARIDLHGRTLAEAHPDLTHFILKSQAQGLRLVLVITGKGKIRQDHGPIPQRVGALRHQVPHWLRIAPLGALVLQVTEAHLRHGGAGAFYVYLRRNGR